MQKSECLRSVSISLQRLLSSNSSKIDKDDIIFSSPATIDGQQTVVSIFLYQIMENIYARNRDREMNPLNPSILLNPPITLDLMYLVTPFAREPVDELDMMEEIINVFHQNAVMKSPILEKSLAETGIEEIRIIPHPLSIEDMNYLWGSFSKPMKTCMTYLVTPFSLSTDKTIAVQRTRNTVLEYGQR